MRNQNLNILAHKIVKVENLAYSVALHFMYYNFYHIHKSLKVTPAMETGVMDQIWKRFRPDKNVIKMDDYRK